MRRTPVFFDPEIELLEIISALAPAGLTLQGDGRGGIKVVRRQGWDKREPKLADNVVPMRSDA